MKLNVDQLDQAGYTIVPNFLTSDMTGRIRRHMDGLLPPIVNRDLTTKNGRASLRHPIPGKLMATILENPDLIDLATQALAGNELRLLEQVLIRSDPHPPPYGPIRWHIDFAFFPRQYNASPRQTYFHMVHCLSSVPSGGGAFMIVPESHHHTYSASEKMQTPEDLTKLKQDTAAIAGINVDRGIEICVQDGDLLIFNPMALHSASGNNADTSRYVYFASFFDVSATELSQHLLDTEYNKGFPDSLRDNLPLDLQSLLDW